MLIRPMPGYILVERITKKDTTKGGVFVRRRREEETSGATVIHPGWYHNEFTQGELVIVKPHCGTDFLYLNRNMTFLKIETVLAKVE